MAVRYTAKARHQGTRGPGDHCRQLKAVGAKVGSPPTQARFREWGYITILFFL